MLKLKTIYPVIIVLLCNASQAKSVDAPAGPAPVSDKPPVTSNPDDKPKKSRGQLLYETHCIACHESGLHIRERRKAKTIADVNQSVARWVNYQKLGWGYDDTQQVADYLNQHFYHYTE